MTAREIVANVAGWHGLTRRKLLSRRRATPYVRARWEAMAWMRQANMSLPEIGQALGGMHHTTVMSGLRKFNKLLDRRRQFIAVSGVTRRDWILRYLTQAGHTIAPASLVAAGAGL